MQYLTIVLAALTTLAAASPTSEPIQKRTSGHGGGSGGGILYCGSQPYYPSAYTCYHNHNNLLCPILGGVKYKPCGPACYDPAEYECVNGQLVPCGSCKGQVYDKNTYVCVDGKQLCPKTAPNACGIACYDSAHYYCWRGQLRQV